MINCDEECILMACTCYKYGYCDDCGNCELFEDDEE